MTTEIEDAELNTELQELYLKSKQWISELDFMESELEFLKKLYGRTFSILVLEDDFEKISEIFIKAAKVEINQMELRESINKFMHQLEHLITLPNQRLNLILIQTDTQLEIRLHALLRAFQSVKGTVFELTKQGLKEGSIPVLPH
jgi:hypothetical protein